MRRLAIVAILLLCGCGGDRTGRARQTVALTLDAPAAPTEVETFARDVAKLSHGTLRIDIVPPRERDEHAVIDSVRSGRYDLGAVGTRNWPAFDPLSAPLLIDSVRLESAVLRSDVTKPMLRSLGPLGFTGVGLLPGPLRRLLGTRGPLRSPADFPRLRIGITPSRVTAAWLRTLGATPVDVALNHAAAGLDGVEAQVSTIAGNGDDTDGSFLTANVALAPRPLVVFGSTGRLARLTAAQRDVLTRAAAAAFSSAGARIAADEHESAAILCRRGNVHLVDGDAAALARAVAPVVRGMNPQAIASITALKRSAALPADPVPGCGPALSAAATAPTRFDGVYRMVTSIQRDSGHDPDPIAENYGDYVFVFSRGRFAFSQDGGTACTWGYGTYTVTADRIEWRIVDGGGIAPNQATNKPGEDYVFRWNRYRDTLTLRPSPGAISPDNFLLKPWRRLASAPTRRYFAKRCPPPVSPE